MITVNIHILHSEDRFNTIPQIFCKMASQAGEHQYAPSSMVLH